MDYELIISEIVQKVAARWETMTQHRQRRYLKKHKKSKKKPTPTHIPRTMKRKKTKQMLRHRLKHEKHRNPLNYDATHNMGQY
jgi:hypothetical protein